MVKWISYTDTGKLVLKSIRLERDEKDTVLLVNGLEIARFTHSGDIVVDAEAIIKAKSRN